MQRENTFEPRHSANLLTAFFLCAIGIILGLQLHLQFVQKINWDEFYFLSLVFDHQRGDLSKPLQTAHVHFFGWLKYVSANEVSQIIAARVIMWIVQLGTLYFMFKIARKFMSLNAAFFAVLSFLGFGFIFIHGTSFRADPIAAFLVSAALYIFAVTKLDNRNLTVLAVTLALSLLVTIKVIFYAPLFVVLALWRLSTETNKTSMFFRLAICAIFSLALFAIGYFVQLSLMPSADVSGSKDMLENAGRTTLLGSGWFPRSRIIQQHFILGAISTLMLILGFLFLLTDLKRRPTKKKQLGVLLTMGLPVLSLIIYRNAFPYYFAFIFPAIALWAGYAAEKLMGMQILLAILTLGIVANIGVQYKFRLGENNQTQYVTLEELHRIFPESVNYIDRSAMMSSHDKSGFFMSSWGLKNYKRKNKAVFPQALKTDIVPALIDNSPEINRALYQGDIPSLLLPQDQQILRENYILHWGHIWVAGKSLYLSKDETTFKNLIPGPYTLQSDYPITINGAPYAPGEVITLPRGAYSARSNISQDVILKWGNNIKAPDGAAPSRPIFTNF